MPISRLLFFIALFLGTSMGISAQDVIYKKDGKKLRVKVIEITDTRIRYTEYTDQDGLVFSLDRSTVREIELESGSVYEEKPPGDDPAYYFDDARRNLKLNFLTVGGGDIMFTYEQVIDPKSSWEATAKLFLNTPSGFGWQSGAGLQFGYKVKTGSVFKGGSYRPKHLLAGGYFRPSIGFGARASDRNRVQAAVFHGGVDIGKQWIFSNIFSLDAFIGFHYYGVSYSNEQSGSFDVSFDREVNLGNMFGIENRAISVGLRVGGVFGSESSREPKRTSKRRKPIN